MWLYVFVLWINCASAAAKTAVAIVTMSKKNEGAHTIYTQYLWTSSVCTQFTDVYNVDSYSALSLRARNKHINLSYIPIEFQSIFGQIKKVAGGKRHKTKTDKCNSSNICFYIHEPCAVVPYILYLCVYAYV